MGFEKPRLPTQPRQGSRYLGEHEHEGKRGDRNSHKHQRSRQTKGTRLGGVVSWLRR